MGFHAMHMPAFRSNRYAQAHRFGSWPPHQMQCVDLDIQAVKHKDHARQNIHPVVRLNHEANSLPARPGTRLRFFGMLIGHAHAISRAFDNLAGFIGWCFPNREHASPQGEKRGFDDEAEFS
jgi:hypothetical protein